MTAAACIAVRAASALAACLFAVSAIAADVRVLSAAAMKGPLAETAAAFERETGHRVLRIAEAMAAKRRLAADGLDVMRKVSSGEAELGITQASEILHAESATLAGPLPESLQLLTMLARMCRRS